MSGIVEDFMALRRAIARSQYEPAQVARFPALLLRLEAHIDWRHSIAYRALQVAVACIETRSGAAMTALHRLDALEVEITQASRALVAAAPAVLRRVGHLALIQGGRAA
jgi:hypothetical protein